MTVIAEKEGQSSVGSRMADGDCVAVQGQSDDVLTTNGIFRENWLAAIPFFVTSKGCALFLCVSVRSSTVLAPFRTKPSSVKRVGQGSQRKRAAQCQSRICNITSDTFLPSVGSPREGRGGKVS